MEVFHYQEGPIEITLTHMSAADILLRCSSVCKRWHNIIGNSVDLWQTLLFRDYKSDINNASKKKRPTSWKREYENSMNSAPFSYFSFWTFTHFKSLPFFHSCLALSISYLSLDQVYRRLLLRENAVENSVKAHPLFDVEMLSASITNNVCTSPLIQSTLKSFLSRLKITDKHYLVIKFK
jgi:hypothetical protein